MSATPTPEPGERLCPWCDHVHDLNADAPCGHGGSTDFTFYDDIPTDIFTGAAT